MGLNKNGTFSYKVNFNIDRAYFVGAIAYHIYEQRNDINKMLPADGLLVVLNSLRRYGYKGWRGATDTDQSIGTDTIDEYNDCYTASELWMNENFPMIKNR